MERARQPAERDARRRLFLGLRGGVGGYAVLLEALVARGLLTWQQAVKTAEANRVIERDEPRVGEEVPGLPGLSSGTRAVLTGIARRNRSIGGR